MPFDYKALSRRWFEEVWNKGRDEVIDEMSALDGVAYGLAEDGHDLPGPDEFRKFYRQFRSGIPDIHITVDQVVAEGDTTAVRFTAHGTHSGDGLGIKATHRRIRFTGICMMRWKNGQIVEGWNEFDAAGLMRQITGPDAPRSPKVKA
jgi:predicted ester cyclase